MTPGIRQRASFYSIHTFRHIIAGLLTAIIHIDDNPGLILDEATRMVEELEATAIMENVEDAQIKELRRLLDFLEGNFFSDGWDDDESEGDEEAET
ncbi:uncharacterized protein Z520_01567 [Fonsecaea multimorphosa CBS 102226]|uniref:Uncharacterized protein n=1 Tax=Fonsecaea multimorphosa CBS 102226 TaxID=1442371 RepID=A0A0D2KHZ2_9EURO|nr:uncharacterized protein Z520_01567 [Fonsecaea multimorphosa CBS 102226]KIY03100.1 hypothetical protein Z520_01567 [Fonsecaea multimorphosa CBS 102226]